MNESFAPRGARRLAEGFLFSATLAACLAAGPTALAAPSYTLFESGQVRPLALSPDKKLLFAVNTPDGRLEIFRVRDDGLRHRASVPVGLEPVAVAARSNDEVWVVNHLSDSVSVVKIDDDGDRGAVVRTLLVGDEPRDIVFAGPGGRRAFVTTAHRGQNSPLDPQLTTPSVGRADVWVFDAEHLGGSLGGDPLTIVTLFSDTPRALAVSPDGSRVYAAAFHSGNRTTALNEVTIDQSLKPAPATNADGVPAPISALVVQFDGAHWRDEAGRAWDDAVRTSLPDEDVFVLDATASPPRQIAGAGGFYTGVGTVLYDMAVNPVSGKVYVSNTEARNVHRFEGPGVFAGHTVRGHVVENRITVLGAGGSVSPRHLNKHVDYASCCAPVPNAESEKSLALPTGMAVSRDGKTLYVAALGSDKIGVFDTAALENDTFVPDAGKQIELSGGGPTGVVLDHDRLYVLTRFDNGVSIVDTKRRREIAHTTMWSPEPARVVNGRRFLYDARRTSSHGDQACGSCHVFADFDSLAWDLGNPDGAVVADPNPMSVPENPALSPPDASFHPMKGPMTTQSLRGLKNHGPMHWRGDRTGAFAAASVQPDGGAFDERAAFKAFQVAFNSLLGRDGPIPDQDMDAFTDFILEVTYPPNPIRALDNSLTAQQQLGRDLFTGTRRFDTETCTRCHTLDPAAGFFGTSGFSSTDFTPITVKVPHLRNAYQKVGAFGLAPNPSFLTNNSGAYTGDQVRGFGFFHDGAADTIDHFLGVVLFSDQFAPEGFTLDATGESQRRAIESFVLAFDSNLAPVVGQQVTLDRDAPPAADARLDLLEARAAAGECDLVVKASGPDGERGFLYLGGGRFFGDRIGRPEVTDASLRAFARHGDRSATFTCAPPGSGVRLGIDRDEDGFLDGDEIDACSDPADPTSTP